MYTSTENIGERVIILQGTQLTSIILLMYLQDMTESEIAGFLLNTLGPQKQQFGSRLDSVTKMMWVLRLNQM